MSGRSLPAEAWPGVVRASLLLLAFVLGLAGGAAAQPAERNTRHALIIGIGEYIDPDVPPLSGIVHDVASARRMARAMAVPDANVRVLRDAQATAAGIRREITALGQRLRDGDRVFVYYSGHGTRWQDDALEGGGCTEGLLAADGEVLTNVELGQRLAPLARRSDKMMVFYDACFSGGVVGQPLRTRSLDIGSERLSPKFVPKFSRAGAGDRCAMPSNFRTRSLALVMQQGQALPENVVHIAASRPDEVSFDSSTIGGFATAAWRDCLLGQAQDLDGSGAITVDEITRCAQARITAALAGQPGILGQQMTVGGNAAFVPAWMGAGFGAAGVAPAPSAQAQQAAAAANANLAAAAANATLAALMGLPPPPAAAAGMSSPSAAQRPGANAVAAAAAIAPAAIAPAAIAPATPAEILAEVHRQRDGARRVVATARQGRLKIGQDTLTLDITPARDGHLYIALAGSDGQSLYLLYPNELATDNRVRAGQRVTLPGPGWEVLAAGPPGPETLLVLVSDAPRDLSLLGREKAGPFMKTLLDPGGRAKLQWVLANGTPARECSVGSAPAAGGAPPSSCSDAFGAALLTVQSVR